MAAYQIESTTYGSRLVPILPSVISDGQIKTWLRDRVAAIRAQGFSQGQVGQKLGLPQPTISKIENEEPYSVGLDTLMNVGRGLRLEMSRLFAEIEGTATYTAEPDRAIVGEAPQPELLQHAGTNTPFSAETREQLTAWLYETLEDASEHSKRLNTRAVMEEMAVAIATRADQQEAERIKGRIRSRRVS